MKEGPSFVGFQREVKRRRAETKAILRRLAIEVGSPTDVFKSCEKIQKYSTGVKEVWLVEPEFQTVAVYKPPMPMKSETLTVEDTLSCEEILPSFQLPLKEIFRQPKTE